MSIPILLGKNSFKDYPGSPLDSQLVSILNTTNTEYIKYKKGITEIYDDGIGGTENNLPP